MHGKIILGQTNEESGNVILGQREYNSYIICSINNVFMPEFHQSDLYVFILNIVWLVYSGATNFEQLGMHLMTWIRIKFGRIEQALALYELHKIECGPLLSVYCIQSCMLKY